VVVPEILLACTAACIIMAGIGALYIGHKMRGSEIDAKSKVVSRLLIILLKGVGKSEYI
jgi:hypothetical protein